MLKRIKSKLPERKRERLDTFESGREKKERGRKSNGLHTLDLKPLPTTFCDFFFF
jgi:hypothetical protein